MAFVINDGSGVGDGAAARGPNVAGKEVSQKNPRTTGSAHMPGGATLSVPFSAAGPRQSEWTMVRSVF